MPTVNYDPVSAPEEDYSLFGYNDKLILYSVAYVVITYVWLHDRFKWLKRAIESWKRNNERECNRLGEPEGLWKLEWPRFKKHVHFPTVDLRAVLSDNMMKESYGSVIGESHVPFSEETCKLVV